MLEEPEREIIDRRLSYECVHYIFYYISSGPTVMVRTALTTRRLATMSAPSSSSANKRRTPKAVEQAGSRRHTRCILIL